MTVSLLMTQHFIYVDNPLESSRIINSDLDKIHIWCTDWLVSFNLQNMEKMLFSKKKKSYTATPAISHE